MSKIGKMTFEELTRLTQEKLGHDTHSQTQVKDLLYWLFDTIEHEALQGRPVRIPNFGTFVKRKRAARTTKVIGTGAIVDIPAITALGFKLSKSRLVKHV